MEQDDGDSAPLDATVASVVVKAAERLRDDLARHVSILQQSDLLAQESAKELLGALSGCLRQVDEFVARAAVAAVTSESSQATTTDRPLLRPLDSVVQDVLSATVLQLGHRDVQTRSALLLLLSDLQTRAVRQVVLDVLPWFAFPLPMLPSLLSLSSPPTAAVGVEKKKKKKRRGSQVERNQDQLWEEATGHVVEGLRALARRDPASLPAVLECLHASPLHDSYRDESFRAALRGLRWAFRHRDSSSSKSSHENDVSKADRSPATVVLQALLSSVPSVEEGTTAWEVLRTEWEKLENRVLRSARRKAGNNDSSSDHESVSFLVLDVVVSSLAASCSQIRSRESQGGGDVAVLARSFLQPLVDDAAVDVLEDIDGNDDYDDGLRDGDDDLGKLSVLDWAGLLVLSQAQSFANSVDEIVDTSIRRCRSRLNAQLVDPLQRVLRWIDDQGRRSPPSQAYQRLAPALTRFGVFMLLSPARVEISSSEDLEAIQSLAIAQHGSLDPDRQRELVQCYLRLLDEVVGWEASHPVGASAGTVGGLLEKHRRSEIASSPFQSQYVCELRSKQHVVRQLINSVLGSLFSTSPAALERFKEVLVRQLGQSSPFGPSPPKQEDESIQDVCRTVARLTLSQGTAEGLHGLASTEAVALVQKLLFATSSAKNGAVKGAPSSLGHRGIQLATELVRFGCLSRDDEERIQEWVLRSLLPRVRRMVDPKMGRHGLHYLEASMARDAVSRVSAGDVFRHLKSLLSNTGLVQILEAYQNTPRKDTGSVLAYRWVPPEFAPRESEKRKTRDMVICIAYFLRRTDDFAPSKWGETVAWVYELANMYLRLGREVATKGWRSDGWLVAPLELPYLRVPPNASDALSTVEAYFFHLDVATDLLPKEPLPLEAAAKSVAELDDRTSIDSMMCFTLSLWVAVALSVAVMKNSYENVNPLSETQRQLEGYRSHRRLLQFQLLKIRCLRMRIDTMEQLFGHLLSSLENQRSPKARGMRDAASLQQARVTIETAVSESANLECFFEPTVLDFGVILDLFCTDVDADFRSALSKIASQTSKLDERLDKEFRSMKLKGALADSIVSTLESPNDCVRCIQANHVAYVLGMMRYLVDILPRLRKGYFARHRQPRQDGFSTESIIALEITAAAALKTMILKLLLSDRYSDVDEKLRLQFTNVCLDGVRLYGGSPIAPSPDPWKPIESLYALINEMLSKCDCLPVATSLVEVLTVFAIIGPARYLDAVASSTLRALHTIYAESEQTNCLRRPVVVDYHLQRFKPGLSSRKYLFQRTIGRLCLLCRERKPGFSLYRVMIVQYFSILSLSGDLIARSAERIESLVHSLVEAYEHPLSRMHDANGTRSSDQESDSATKSGSTLPFLVVDFFEDYFEFLLNALVGVMVSCPPCTMSTAGAMYGPYVHIAIVLQLIRKVLLLYKNRFVAFSKKSVPLVFELSRLALSSVIYQIQQCVSWRNNQPYPVDYPNGAVGSVYDPGSTVFLRRLLDAASGVFRAIFDVCDLWQSRNDVANLLSKSTRLRQTSNNALQTLNHIASVHNWSPPKSKSCSMFFDSIIEVQHDGARENTERSVSNTRESVIDDSISRDDSDATFCATGDWG